MLWVHPVKIPTLASVDTATTTPITAGEHGVGAFICGVVFPAQLNHHGTFFAGMTDW
jgi:hypothetical protein